MGDYNEEEFNYGCSPGDKFWIEIWWFWILKNYRNYMHFQIYISPFTLGPVQKE